MHSLSCALVSDLESMSTLSAASADKDYAWAELNRCFQLAPDWRVKLEEISISLKASCIHGYAPGVQMKNKQTNKPSFVYPAAQCKCPKCAQLCFMYLVPWQWFLTEHQKSSDLKDRFLSPTSYRCLLQHVQWNSPLRQKTMSLIEYFIRGIKVTVISFFFPTTNLFRPFFHSKFFPFSGAWTKNDHVL